MHRNSKTKFHKCEFNILTIRFFSQVKTRCKVNNNFLNTQIMTEKKLKKILPLLEKMNIEELKLFWYLEARKKEPLHD